MAVLILYINALSRVPGQDYLGKDLLCHSYSAYKGIGNYTRASGEDSRLA